MDRIYIARIADGRSAFKILTAEPIEKRFLGWSRSVVPKVGGTVPQWMLKPSRGDIMELEASGKIQVV